MALLVRRRRQAATLRAAHTTKPLSRALPPSHPPTWPPQAPRGRRAAVITYQRPDLGVADEEAEGRAASPRPAAGGSLQAPPPRASGAPRTSRLPLLSPSPGCCCRLRAPSPPCASLRAAGGRRRLPEGRGVNRTKWRRRRRPRRLLVAARLPVRHRPRGACGGPRRASSCGRTDWQEPGPPRAVIGCSERSRGGTAYGCPRRG